MRKPWFYIGAALLVVGSMGEGAAVVMEIISQEPIYMLLMKIFPWFFGCGALFIGVWLAGRRKGD